MLRLAILPGMATTPARRVEPALLVILAGVVAALHVGKLPPAIPVLRDALAAMAA